MSDTSTARKVDRRVVITLAVAGLVVFVMIFSMLSPNDTSGDISGSVGRDAGRDTAGDTTEPGPAGLGTTTAPGTAGPFDRGTFDAYWNSGVVQAFLGYVTAVTWENGTLTAHTSLFPDADAVDPADKMCRALAAYWTQAGQPFHPVRVLDHTGNVMTSRPAESDSCRWRQ